MALMIAMDRTKRHNRYDRGITLVELLVAFGIFSVLVAIATGGFMQAMRVQRVSNQLMEVNDNMALTIEQMMREMRTGYHFCTRTNAMDYPGITADVTAQCASLAADEIQFVNAANAVIRYRLKGNAIQKGISLAVSDPTACSGGELDPANEFCYRTITADNVKVASAHFEPRYNRVDNYPPRVSMSFAITSTDPIVQGLTSPLTIQTTVSARCGQGSCPADP